MVDLSSQTIALSLGAGALITALCRRLRVPALLPLLGAGMALGTSGLGVIDGEALGPALKGFITAAIGLLIFEGALHLTRDDLRRAPRAVWGLLTIGAVTTWVLASVLARFVLGFPWPVAALLGAALIVTGPTVVQPILRRVKVSARVKMVLSAEAILIDPIGVLATVATLEVVRTSLGSGFDVGLAREGAWRFFAPLLGGAGIGVVLGGLGYLLLTRLGRGGRVEPHILNLLGVGICMSSVGLGEALAPEAGLAAVTVCGVWIARARILGATEMRAFKELLATLLVGTLFILLASRFDLAQVRTITWREGLFVAALLLVVRPIGAMLSTWRSLLSGRERAFVALFAPRGIVALSVASIAVVELTATLGAPGEGGPVPEAVREAVHRLELVMFVVIVVSVLIASLGASLLAIALDLQRGAASAVVLVGAHPLSLALARTLTSAGIGVRVLDSNGPRVEDARAEGIDAVQGDATDARWLDDAGAPPDAGWLIAWTGNADVDALAARWGSERLGEGHAAVWTPREEPAAPALPGCEAHPLPILLELVRQDRIEVVRVESPDPLVVVLGAMRKGTFTLASAGLPAAGKDTTFVGIRERPGSL